MCLTKCSYYSTIISNKTIHLAVGASSAIIVKLRRVDTIVRLLGNRETVTLKVPKMGLPPQRPCTLRDHPLAVAIPYEQPSTLGGHPLFSAIPS